jgi:hypothetical protein
MNKQLLQQVAGEILVKGDNWNQGYWGRLLDPETAKDLPKLPYWLGGRMSRAKAVPPTCGTAMCCAGWALAVDDPGMKMLIGTGGADNSADWALLSDGHVVEIEQHAALILGLTYEERNLLFAGSNSIGDIMQILTDWGVFGELRTQDPGYID